MYRLKAHKTKYSFIEPGRHLRGRELNLTLVWCVMPRVGECKRWGAHRAGGAGVGVGHRSGGVSGRELNLKRVWCAVARVGEWGQRAGGGMGRRAGIEVVWRWAASGWVAAGEAA